MDDKETQSAEDTSAPQSALDAGVASTQFFDPEWDPPPFPTGMIEEDGEPLESDWHRLNIGLLVESIRWHWRERTDYYVAGNMFIYYNADQVRSRDYRGPDFFVVQGVPYEPPRKYWAVWEQFGKYPNVIIELMSPTTAKEDLTVKKDLYESTFRTPNYFSYDPDKQQLLGWRRASGQYEPLVPNEKGQLWCEELGLWLGKWEGTYLGHSATWLRFFDEHGQVVPIGAEAEKQRADALAAEVARLKQQLTAQTNKQ
jgi:Uma2 family endonuclease